uniref:Uncharacterized protein n=1 Tax=Rhizophora mucronata TaxID=61149 RepID=A0A2P2P7Q0_RHIMU
MYAMWMLTL